MSFRYLEDKPLIEDLSLIAEPGQTVAIVGPTGAGKTTLVNLMMRFYELDSGRITLDGVDISHMTRRDLRSHMGMVLQDTWLFDGTIRENIAYGRPDATEEEVLAAARATYVDRFVHSLPDGYDTVLDDEGVERQRGGEAAPHYRASVPGEPERPDPGRGNQLCRHPNRGARSEGDECSRADRTSFVIAHRLFDHSGRRRHSGDGSGTNRRAGHPRAASGRSGAYYNLYNAQFAQAMEEVA